MSGPERPTAAGEINNVVIDHRGELPYWEGQSYGVLPPGIDPKKNKPYGVRLYSIASTRYGDDKLGKTTTLCVRRSMWTLKLARKGVCSNMLCNAKPGDKINITGPSGKGLAFLGIAGADSLLYDEDFHYILEYTSRQVGEHLFFKAVPINLC